MNYKNGREAQVGDAIVTPQNWAGIVAKLDGEEKLEFLSFAERQVGEPYTLIPVTVKGRHFEPVGVTVRANQCLHVEDALKSKGKGKKELDEAEAAIGQLKEELARANATVVALQEQLRQASPAATPAVEDPNQMALPGSENGNGTPSNA